MGGVGSQQKELHCVHEVGSRGRKGGKQKGTKQKKIAQKENHDQDRQKKGSKENIEEKNERGETQGAE